MALRFDAGIGQHDGMPLPNFDIEGELERSDFRFVDIDDPTRVLLRNIVLPPDLSSVADIERLRNYDTRVALCAARLCRATYRSIVDPSFDPETDYIPSRDVDPHSGRQASDGHDETNDPDVVPDHVVETEVRPVMNEEREMELQRFEVLKRALRFEETEATSKVIQFASQVAWVLVYDGCIFVVFRGSKRLREWIYDFRAWPSPIQVGTSALRISANACSASATTGHLTGLS